MARFSQRPRRVEVAPLRIDGEVSSLSAIVLDDAYYELLLIGTKIVDGLSVLDGLHLILFKAKAYLDLKACREKGEQVDSRKIKKHKRDALRLTQLLSGNERVDLSGAVAADMGAFLSDCEVEPVNLKQIGIVGVSMEAILDTLRKVYIHDGPSV